MYHKIATSSTQILHFKINDLLDYTLAEQDELNLKEQNVNINNLVIEVIEAFEYQARLKKLNFIVMLDQLLPQVMITDSDRIRQILFNLI